MPAFIPPPNNVIGPGNQFLRRASLVVSDAARYLPLLQSVEQVDCLVRQAGGEIEGDGD
jgi:hypothetical protein